MLRTKNNEFSFMGLNTGPALHFETDGKIVECVEGVDIYSNEVDTSSAEYAAWFNHRLISRYRMNIEVRAITCVQAGLRRIRRRHRISERYFIEMAFNSQFVPRNRHIMVGKGLYQGYIGEYGVAMHVLAPQLEGIVRQHLHDTGEITDHRPMGAPDTQAVTGLSRLIGDNKQLCEKLYGESTTFELDALFCQSAGLNLRNDVAHGLLDDGRANNRFTMYAWVYLLGIVLSCFANNERA